MFTSYTKQILTFITLTNSIFTTTTSAHLHIGCSFEKEKPYLKEIANQSVHDHRKIIKDYNFNVDFTFKDSGCNASNALGQAAQLLLINNASVLIGPSCNEACPAVSWLSDNSDVPMISYGCSAMGLPTKSDYLQTSPHLLHNLRNIARIYIDFIYNICRWTKMSIVFSDKEPWASLTRYMEEEMTKYPNNIVTKYLTQRYNLEELTAVVRTDARSK